MPANNNEITEEMLGKAMQCKDADELVALAKTFGIGLTKKEAEAFLAEMDDVELDDESLKMVAGGIFECYMRHNCGYIGDDWK